MQITYDREADALAVSFVPYAKSARTARISEGVNFDYDAEGNLIAIEILGASHTLPKEHLDTMPLAEVRLTLLEAADRAGLDPDTLRSLINKGRLFGQKRGRDWTITLAELYNYLDSRDTRGRPSLQENVRSLKSFKAKEGQEAHAIDSRGEFRIKNAQPSPKKYARAKQGRENPKNVHTVPRQGGGWVNKVGGHDVSTHPTQEKASQAARSIAKANKSEHVIHGRDGKIRDKDSKGRDPHAPKGRR